MLAACGSEEESIGLAGRADAVRISASVGLATRSNPLGSAEEQARFADGDAIAVCDGTGTTLYTMQQDGTWTSDSYLKWGDTPVTFRTWYPGDVADNSFSQGTLQTDQSTPKALQQSDYMTCEQTVATVPDSRTLHLTMERRMALVTVCIKEFNNQFDGAAPTISSIAVCSQYASVPATGNATAITPYRSVGDGGAGTTYSAIVTPGDGAADEAFIRLTVAYGENRTTPELIVRGIPRLEAGKRYTCNLTVGKDAATINGVSVEEWTTDVLGGGEADVAVRVDESTHSITLSQDGVLTEAAIAKAVGESKTLVIKGFMAESDFGTLASYIKNNLDAISTLDMGDCTSTEIPDRFLFYTSGSNIIKIPITSLVLPKGTVYIGYYAFRSTNITSLTLPETVERIETKAFEEGNLKKVTIPENVIFFGSYMFRKQTELESVTFEGTTPPFCGTMLFPDNLKTIYVPKGTKDAYLLRLNYDPTIDWDSMIQEY